MSALRGRLGQALVVEGHVTLVQVIGAVLLLESGRVLAADPYGRTILAALAVGAAVGALIAAILPWVLSATPLEMRRVFSWSSCFAAGAVAGAAVVDLDLQALLATQLLLIAAIVAELPRRPTTLRWLWFSIMVCATVIALYYALVPLRPIAD